MAKISTTPPATTLPGTVYAADPFSRTVSGGWGSAEIGGSYTPFSSAGVGATFTVNGSSGTMRGNAASFVANAYLHDVVVRDLDASLRVRTDKLATGSTGQQFAVLLRRQSSSERYEARLRFLPGGSVQLRAANASGATIGTLVILATV